MTNPERISDAASMANIIREMAYAAAQFVATDDGYWREQLDYLEGQLRARLSGERPSPVYAEDVAREISRARRSPPAQEGMVLDAPAREGGGETKLIDDIINGTAPMSKWMGSVDYSTYDGFEEYLKTQLREKLDLKVRLDKKRHESAEDESLATFVDGGSGALEAALATYRTVRERVAAASPAEPAAHSLQTLAPASDAVKPGDET